MSNQSEGQDRPDGIDTIKQLLLKLEDAVARDGADPASEQPILLGFEEPTPQLDAAVLKTAVKDAAVLETAVLDTAVLDTAVLDTAVLDTAVMDAAVMDTAVAVPALELSALRRGTSVAKLADGPSSILISQPITIDLPASAAAQMLPSRLEMDSRKSRGGGMVLAASSFLLGIAVAGGLLFVLDPFKQKSVHTASVAQAASHAPTSSKPSFEASIAGSAQVEPRATEPRPAEAQSAVRVVEAAREAAAEASAPMGSIEPTKQPSPPSVTANTIVAPVPAPAVPSLREAPVQALPQEPLGRVAASVAGGGPALDMPAIAPMPRSASTPAPAAIADARPKLLVARAVELRPGESRPIDLRIDPPVQAEAKLLVIFRKLPAWLKLSNGGSIGNDIWLLPAHDAGSTAVEVDEGAEGTAAVTVQLTRIDGQILAEAELSVRALAQPRPQPSTTLASPISHEMILRFQARGELLLDTGEIEAARTLLRTAAEAGSVVAAMRLAETYDPAEIPRLGMHERSADPVLAVKWYEHAHTLGSPVAAARLVILGRK